MTGPESTGIPEVDALIAAHDAERDRLNRMIAVRGAESAAATARVRGLAEQQLAARRRWSAAKGLLSKARRDGSAAKIATARERCDQAYAEFERLSGAAIAETVRIHGARLDELGATMAQMRRTWDAGSAVTGALKQPREGTPPAEAGR
ncbi:hypothetical protein [Amycolatopsis rubida]|uniref:Uncharacterized protein n=1 Tax=Amycolatopsis rubida TaxID=112413 RepID=A0A1I5X420_9PSEU|nr:hypothetical protein [Amycolatopsis rubida]SFQ26719.1 hypothetical protein SAMN05421854_11023 [Amycolatopsis rubida]